MGVGKAYLVGAGPGAPGLLTVRGLRLLLQADVIVADSLLPEDYLEQLGVSTGGKTVHRLASGATVRGDQIELMVAAARRGRTVVRLKGGDPFVFGRCNEEIERLSEHGIPWEVVPGVSACTAAPGAADLPVTSRPHGRSFAVVTARCAGGEVNQSFPKADSLVVFMGVAALEDVVARLLRDGWPADTPAAIVERATLPWERRIFAPLGRLAERARAQGVGAPAAVLVGAAARGLPPRTARPRVLYTGLNPANFRTLGSVVHWPALTVEEEPAGREMTPALARRLDSGAFAWVIFTSKVGVRSFFAALEELGRDARLLGSARIVAAGAGTASELRARGLLADAVPAEPGSRGILQALGAAADGGVLLVQGTHAPRGLEDELTRRGAQVTRLALHRVVPHPALGAPLPDHDVIYFTSPSGVRAYWETYGPDAFREQVWCIGEVTRDELGQIGVKAEIVNPAVSSAAADRGGHVACRVSPEP